MTQNRLPIPGRDNGEWGQILNDFLLATHNSDGTLKALSQSQVDGLVQDLAGKADSAAVLYKGQDETITGTITIPEQPARTGQIRLHSVNNASGFIQKNILFIDQGVLSRGGPVWVDSNGRTQAWLGWHDQIPGGSSHHGVEVKTAADPAGPNSAVLVTRFRLKSDADQTQAALYSCEMFYIENGIYSPDTQFGITFNTPQVGSVAAGTSSGKYTLGKLTVSADSSGVATMDLGVGLENTTGGRLRIFRDSNIPAANIAVYAADATNRQTLYIDAKTGGLTMAGRLQLKSSTDAPLMNVSSSVDVSGHTIIDSDVITSDTVHNATFRLFRNTNTSLTRSFRILKGDGTNTDSFVVNAGSGDVTVTGNLNIAGNITANNLFDEAELRRSSNVSTLSRLSAASNLALTAGTVYGVLAYAKIAGNYSKIRFSTGTTVNALSDVRLGVYNASNTLLASTTNLSGTITTGSTLYDNLALDTTLTLTTGQQVYLAIAYTGTTLNVRGSTIASGMAGLAPVLAKTTAYAGGALPALGSAATGNVAWLELVP